MSEIGSEFSFSAIRSGEGLKFPDDRCDSCFTFSGRTAIETVIRNESIKNVLMPSYCCDSMIEPFRKAGIETDFYAVEELNNIKIEDCSRYDSVLLCNYFGFNSSSVDLSGYIKNGGIVIEDITHSLLSEHRYNSNSTYLVASLRKWFPIICGGYVSSLNKPLKEKPTKYPSIEFLNMKKKAMKDKADYLSGNSNIEKSSFLSLFSESNKWLSDNYSDMQIDNESLEYLKNIDLNFITEKRKNNAKILLSGLKKCKNIRSVFDASEMDCPLFVPVIVENGARNDLRKRLIDNNIYCPVHWPKPDHCNSSLYDAELSLICDQRYNDEDMKRIIDVLSI